MKIGLLVIGSEVLDGKVSDLNTKILSEFLRTEHLEIHEAMTARDTDAAIKHGLKTLLSRNDLVITTGGLGPTRDDITKESIASFLGKKIIFSQKAQEISEGNYKKFDRTFPGKEHGYCFLPEGFKPLSNSSGFAPGFSYKDENKIIISAPGVPREFKSILEDHLMDLISDRVDKSIFMDTLMARTKGIPEEKIFNEVDPELWEKLEAFGEVSSLPVLMGVDIRVKIKSDSVEKISSLVAAAREVFENSPIKSSIWNYGNETLEEKIVRIANNNQIKFGFAESATGGLCSHRITNIPGSSNCLMGSIVCYDEQVKQGILGVKKETLDKHTAVSLETAKEMAKGLREHLSLDIAISITGYAGPGGGNDKFPVGSVCIGSCVKDQDVKARDFLFKGERILLKERFAQAALHSLLVELENFASR